MRKKKEKKSLKGFSLHKLLCFPSFHIVIFSLRLGLFGVGSPLSPPSTNWLLRIGIFWCLARLRTIAKVRKQSPIRLVKKPRSRQKSQSLKWGSLCKKMKLSGGISLIFLVVSNSQRFQTFGKVQPFPSFCELTVLIHIIPSRPKAWTNFAMLGVSQDRAGSCHWKVNTPMLARLSVPREVVDALSWETTQGRSGWGFEQLDDVSAHCRGAGLGDL